MPEIDDLGDGGHQHLLHKDAGVLQIQPRVLLHVVKISDVTELADCGVLHSEIFKTMSDSYFHLFFKANASGLPEISAKPFSGDLTFLLRV